MDDAKPIGVPALQSVYQKMASVSSLVKELNVSIDLGEVTPNIPQMGRFFSSMSSALQIATQVELPLKKHSMMRRQPCGSIDVASYNL